MSVPETATFSVEYRKLDINKFSYFVPAYAEHRPAAKRLLQGKLYEPQTHRLIRSIFKAVEGSMVHAGTFFGDMIPSFSRAVSGTLWCFEPVIENYILANLSVSKNRLKNVFLMNAALSEKVGMVRINSGAAGTQHRGGGSFVDKQGTPVPSVPIDHFTYDRLIVIQLDVEGHELPVLKGAVQTIRQFKPLIMIEDNRKHCTPFLESEGYGHWRKIPGLSIWRHPENAVLSEVCDKLDAELTEELAQKRVGQAKMPETS